MSWRGVTLQTRAASAAERRRRPSTSPSFAIRTCASASRVSGSATALQTPLTPDSAIECCRRTIHVSMTRTDIETWLLASSPNGRALALPVRDLDRGVIPSEPRTLELRPETPYLDAEWIFHLCGLHRSQHRRVPALGGVALRLDEPHHRGSRGRGPTTRSCGHSSRERLRRGGRSVRRRRPAPHAWARSGARPRSRGSGAPRSLASPRT